MFRSKLLPIYTLTGLLALSLVLIAMVQSPVESPRGTSSATNAAKTIPIIFHVVHKTDETGKLSVSEIQNQVSVLNGAFGGIGSGFAFEIAAIIYVEDDALFTNVGPTVPDAQLQPRVLDPEHYVNVFTGDLDQSATFYGEASFPTDYDEDDQQHMIVIDHIFFPDGADGDFFDDGDLLVHELGHYLGKLLHPFGTTCTNDADTSSSDPPGVGDTAITSLGGGNIGYCGSANATCTGDEDNDPVSNYMMYTCDGLRTGFSPDQEARFLSFFGSDRQGLGTSNGTITIPSTHSVALDDAEVLLADDYHLIVEGTLTASGSTFGTFESAWFGIDFTSGSVGTFTNDSVIQDFNAEGGSIGIDVQGGTVTLTNSKILNAEWPWGYGIEVSSGTATLTDSYVFSDRGHGALARSDGYVYLKNTDFEVYLGASGLSAAAAHWGGDVIDTPSAVYYGHGNLLRATGPNAIIKANDGTYLCGTSLGVLPEMVYAGDNGEVQVDNAFWAALPTSNHTTTYNGGVISDDFETLDASCNLSSSKRGSERLAKRSGSSPIVSTLGRHLVGLARDAIKGTDHSAAEQYYRSALVAGDDDKAVALAMDGLVATARRTGNYGSSVAAIESAASLYPDLEALAISTKARLLALANDHRGALATLNEFRTQPDHILAELETSVDLAYIWKDHPGRVARLLAKADPATDEQARALLRAYEVAELTPPGDLRARSGDAERQSKRTSSGAVTVSAYPNPFNPTAFIALELPDGGVTTVRVFDVLGREVAVLADGPLSAGVHRFRLDGSRLPSGIYLYRVSSNGTNVVGTLNLVK